MENVNNSGRLNNKKQITNKRKGLRVRATPGAVSAVLLLLST